MSAYNGRRAPNVSQYLANLNTIPSAADLAAVQNDINLGDDGLDFLTNTEFFDFDSFNPNLDLSQHPSPRDEAKSQRVSPTGAQYQFGEFQAVPQPVGSSPNLSGLQGQYPPQPNHQLAFGSQVGDKRKASNAVLSAADLEEQGRFAAEEDKRRRNTAASARFRVKKKQREQALEKQAKEMTDKVQQLETKVQQLEMENKWLKGLITDKNEGKSLEVLQKEKETEERSTEDRTDGVGTDEEIKPEA